MPSNRVAVRVRISVKPKPKEEPIYETLSSDSTHSKLAQVSEFIDRLSNVFQIPLVLIVGSIALLFFPLTLVWFWYTGRPILRDDEGMREALIVLFVVVFWFYVIYNLLQLATDKFL